ncbi:MAG TPA: prepilin-type N-terminal cleavage/methylation domain-containing protein, partial [Myxococcaceae bacterium]|nr:prepilin-type N-terminal cleavage/methylation domain-containing protein [Myxococcaceae bacterium]
MRALAIRRGVTLIELLVTLAVASLVMVAITNAFLAQTRQYQSLAGRREVNSGGRLGLKMIEENLRLAGFGVDPNLAIAAYDSWDPDANGGAGALASDTSFPDAIVIHQRDPNFQRTITSAGGGVINFQQPLRAGYPLLPGQILLALCSGAQQYTYVTVAARAEP